LGAVHLDEEEDMARYVGFIRGTKDSQGHLGPEQAQRVLERYIEWSEDMDAAGTLLGGGALSRSGRVVRRSDGSLTSTDGPHTEAAEIVGGYIEIQADDLDQAEKIFGTHPHLEFGVIEVRKIGERGCED
jgi:hypothetical protein